MIIFFLSSLADQHLLCLIRFSGDRNSSETKSTAKASNSNDNLSNVLCDVKLLLTIMLTLLRRLRLLLIAYKKAKERRKTPFPEDKGKHEHVKQEGKSLCGGE